MKRILVLLTVAAIFAAVMAISAVSAVADPNCAQVPNNKNCVPTTSAPGGSEDANGKAGEHNPNFTTRTNFNPPGRG